MKLQSVVESSSVMMPSLKNIGQILVASGSVTASSSINAVSTSINFTTHAMYKIDTPDEAESLDLSINAVIKGIKGKPSLQINSNLLICFSNYESLNKIPHNQKFDALIDLLFLELAHLQMYLLKKTDLRLKKASTTYERMIGNQTYGSQPLIPSKLIGTDKFEELDDIEKATLEASWLICNSLLDNIMHIFKGLYLKPEIKLHA